MIQRRDFLLGGSCVAAAVAGTVARPRRHVRLLTGSSIAEIVPLTFAEWISQDVGDPLAINGPESLTARLYNQLVTRVYTNTKTNDQVMMLLAYAKQQTDDLQLHRPEVCYPAFGYTLVQNQEIRLPVKNGVELPSRRLIAQAADRREYIIYWTRMGELLPASGNQQRADRLRIAMHGVIPDGILSRFSTVFDNDADAWRVLQTFIPELLLAVVPKYRAALIGTERADKLTRV